MPKPAKHVFVCMYAKVRKGDVARIFDHHLVGGEPVAELKAAPEFW